MPLYALSEHAEAQMKKLSAMSQTPKNKSQLTAWTNLWNFLNDPARPECKLTQTQKEFLTTELFMIDYNLAIVLQPKPKVETLETTIVEKTTTEPSKSERQISNDVSEMNDMVEKITTILNKHKNDPKQEYVVAFCNDTLDRIKKYGKNTRFTDKQIAFINKHYNSEDKQIGTTTVTVVSNEKFPKYHRMKQYNQELNWNPEHVPTVLNESVYKKWTRVIYTMFAVIADEDNNEGLRFKENVVTRHTSIPDYSKFNDYTAVQLQWLMKLMTIGVIIEKEQNNSKIPRINQILDELYELKANPADIKLSEQAKTNANLFLEEYKQHPMMLKLKYVIANNDNF